MEEVLSCNHEDAPEGPFFAVCVSSKSEWWIPELKMELSP
jgi:hypothetical protein